MNTFWNSNFQESDRHKTKRGVLHSFEIPQEVEDHFLGKLKTDFKFYIYTIKVVRLCAGRGRGGDS